MRRAGRTARGRPLYPAGIPGACPVNRGCGLLPLRQRAVTFCSLSATKLPRPAEIPWECYAERRSTIFGLVRRMGEIALAPIETNADEC